MKSKVKKLFSKFSVKAYDYPFIVGFLEAKGINDVVPTIDMNSRMCINYEIFKDWWKQNCEQKQPKCADERVHDGNCGIRSDANPCNAKLRFIIGNGDKSVVLNIPEILDEFMQYNFKQAERILFDRPHFRDLGYFLRKHIISDILD